MRESKFSLENMPYQIQILGKELQEIKAEVQAIREEQQVDFIDRTEVAEMLGVTVQTVHSYVERGFLRQYSIGSTKLYSKGEITNYLFNSNSDNDEKRRA